MQITITEQEYQDLMRVKRKHTYIMHGLDYITREDFYIANNITLISQVIELIKNKIKVEELLK